MFHAFAAFAARLPVRASVIGVLALVLVLPSIPFATERPAEDITPEEPAPAPAVCRYPDLVYGQAGATELHLDLVCPSSPGPHPAVLVFHGGGWMSGDRKFCAPILETLAERGYVAVAVGYRLTTEAPFPAQLHDAQTALRWLREHSSAYDIDPDRIGALGYSAGGHLALLLATMPEPSSRVQAVVATYAPTDLARWYEEMQGNSSPAHIRFLVKGSLHGLLGGSPAKKASAYAEASPIAHLTKDTAPTLLIHGLADDVVPVDQSMRYATAAGKLGAPVRLECLEHASHGFGSGAGEAHGTRADARTLAYFDEHLHAAPK
jgi:acetyl esterase/lipase